MDAVTTAGLRLGSAVVGPLIKKLFRAEEAGAGLIDQPVRIASLVSIGGEKRSMNWRDLEKLAEELVDRAVGAHGPHDLPEEYDGIVLALAETLSTLGQVDMDDVQAVRLGHDGLAEALRRNEQRLISRFALSRDAELLYDRLLRLACLHIIDFFTKRSTFVARTLVEQSRQTERLVRTLDLIVERLPAPHSEDAKFEERYRRYLVQRHGRLTIFGIDVDDEWPLDDAYLSLEANDSETRPLSAALEGDHGYEHRLPRRAEQALAGLERVLLRGVAGSGKTTLVQWLAVTAAENRLSGSLAHLMGRVPFVLPLRTLTRAGSELPPPRDFLSSVGCPHTPPTGWAERALSAGRGLLLVDGIDEVPEPQRDGTRRWLRELVEEFPGNVCIVTGRPSAVREGWLSDDEFHELSLAPMSREDVGAFIERWHHAAKMEEARAEALLTAVRSRQDLSRLATNPLMCGLLCALHRTSHGYLPRGREELYEAALRMLLERRDRQRSIEHELRMDARSQTMLLERLAYWLIRNGHSQMERADVVDLIDQALPTMHRDAVRGSAEDVYRHLLDRSGLLREPAEGVVDFVHRTFQDYLAARAAIENRDFPLLVRNAHLDQWEDVVRMAVAHGRPEERKRLLKQLIKRGDTVRKHRVRLHLLAMACLEHATQLDPDIRREVEQRAAALIPPRTSGEAESLAGVGQVVLQVLPAPEGLTDDEAEAVVFVATEVATDAALPKLAEFRDHPSYQVRQALLRNWDAFDPERFNAEILSGLPLDGKPHLWVANRAELAALRNFLDYPYLALFSDFSEEEISEALEGRRPRELSLGSERLTDLNFLGCVHSLERLSLVDGETITDLTPLANLPLKNLLLRKMSRLQDFRCLNSLSGLHSLELMDGVPCLDLRTLPTQAPLTFLGIPSTVTDLTQIGAWQELEALSIHPSDLLPSSEGAVPNSDSLAAVAELPVLNRLGVAPPVLQAFRESRINLSGVTHLNVFNIEEEQDIRGLAPVFPELRELVLSRAGPTWTEVDTGQLSEFGNLSAVRANGWVRLANPDRLPQVNVSQRLDSRY
ncbi:NACHT domain-containing protein [Streptomyces bathyalis]|uniref:NACHT domain-containing protein n=1 Tax=Streptomyces bathyalis TaxID=2710756 RepID=A0A7T1T746_9ACTN|nr:NACHT domain-containing protein [Streptomyces bathyalis]QPP07563.1 NACHT domain-containing protein [Streptomyces bathyalis]